MTTESFVSLLNKIEPQILTKMKEDCKSLESSAPSKEITTFSNTINNILHVDTKEDQQILKQVRWEDCSTVLMEKIISYEKVHPIHDWKDIKQRMGFDRRCFSLFQHSQWQEPLIFVWVALMKEIPSSIHQIIPVSPKNASITFQQMSEPPKHITDSTEATTAVFYSINSSGQGQRGIGNLLIKETCKPLTIEFPSMYHILRRRKANNNLRHRFIYFCYFISCSWVYGLD